MARKINLTRDDAEWLVSLIEIAATAPLYRQIAEDIRAAFGMKSEPDAPDLKIAELVHIAITSPPARRVDDEQ